MSALMELAARVEAASGADRELDAEIAIMLDGFGSVAYMSPAYLHAVGNSFADIGKYTGVPAYTASLDAATSVFPADCFYRSGHDGAGPDVTMFFCEAIPSLPNGQPARSVRSVALTEELARLAAALRARAAIEGAGV